MPKMGGLSITALLTALEDETSKVKAATVWSRARAPFMAVRWPPSCYPQMPRKETGTGELISPYKDTNYTGSEPHPITSFALNYLHHGPICKYSLTVLRGWLRARHVQSIRDPHGRLQRAAHLSLPQPQTWAFPQDLLSLPLTMKRPAKKSPKMFFIKPQCACKSSRCFVNKVILQGSRLEVAGSHRGRQARDI